MATDMTGISVIPTTTLCPALIPANPISWSWYGQVPNAWSHISNTTLSYIFICLPAVPTLEGFQMYTVIQNSCEKANVDLE